MPTIVGRWPTLVGRLPTIVGHLPTIVGRWPTLVGRLPTVVGQVRVTKKHKEGDILVFIGNQVLQQVYVPCIRF
jgi:hypothetical protein